MFGYGMLCVGVWGCVGCMCRFQGGRGVVFVYVCLQVCVHMCVPGCVYVCLGVVWGGVRVYSRWVIIHQAYSWDCLISESSLRSGKGIQEYLDFSIKGLTDPHIHL